MTFRGWKEKRNPRKKMGKNWPVMWKENQNRVLPKLKERGHAPTVFPVAGKFQKDAARGSFQPPATHFR